MKKFIAAIVLVLMTAGTAAAHGGVNFRIGVGIPLFPYSYPAYSYPAPYGYYYSAPYGYYYPPAYYPPAVVYGYDPFYGRVIINRGFGHHGHFDHFGHGHGGFGHGGFGHGGFGHGRGFRR